MPRGGLPKRLIPLPAGTPGSKIEFYVIYRGDTIFRRLFLLLSPEALLARVLGPGMHSGLIGKLLLVFVTAAMLTVVIAAVAWLSFKQVVGTQAKIVDEAIPTMAAVQSLSTNIARIGALVQQLPLVNSRDEAGRISQALGERLEEMRGTLDRFEAQHVDDEQSRNLRATAEAINKNLHEQAARTEQRLALDELEREAFARQRAAVKALLGLAETMVANASATTTANVANLYRLLDRDGRRDQIYESLDRMTEVDIDTMERMSEFQFVCVNIQTLLEQLEGEQRVEAIPEIAERFATYLGTLKRRVDDIRDPSLKKISLAHYKVLSAASREDGIFSLHHARLTQRQSLQLLRSEGARLASQLNEQASALVTTGGEVIETAGRQGQGAVDRGLLGFLIVAILLFVALIVTLWVVYRYHVLGRLSGMEKAARALSTGNFDVDIATGGNHPLAPLGRALEQVRENVRERERLEKELRRHQGELEAQVAERTAELKESNALLEREVSEHALARQAAEEANAAKNLFLGSLSHELRTPLSGVSGATRLLRETGLDSRQAEYVNMIGYANSTLLEILEDMLSFSRIEAGKLELQLQPFDLRQALEDMLALQSVPAQGKGIALVSEIPASLPRFVVGDRGKLNQLLLNIIGNAIKFTDEGAVTLAVHALGDAPAGNVRLRFTVSDTGIGIPEEKLAEVFKPFFQVEETAHQRHGGAGLGLAICQRIVQAMGGEIAAESREGEGTSLSFVLEFATVDRLPQPEPATDLPAWRNERPLRVLVVEDDEINRTVCARYLELLGHTPLLAGEGAEALAQLAGNAGKGQRVDAVLMDISLPGMSGFEVAEKLRALDDGRWRCLPVIIMSAHVSAPAFTAHSTAGFSAFLGKPFSLDALARALHGVSGGRESQSGASSPLPNAVAASGKLLDFAFLNDELDALGEATFSELLMLFKNDLPALFSQIDALFEAADWPALAARAHRLRGAAGNLGMSGVLEAARLLETEAGRETPDKGRVAEQVGELKTACVRGCEELYDWLLAQREFGVQG